MPLIPYHDQFCPPRFPKAASPRARQKIAVKYQLPIIRIGRSTLIDEEAGDERAVRRHIGATARATPGTRPRRQKDARRQRHGALMEKAPRRQGYRRGFVYGFGYRDAPGYARGCDICSVVIRK